MPISQAQVYRRMHGLTRSVTLCYSLLTPNKQKRVKSPTYTGRLTFTALRFNDGSSG